MTGIVSQSYAISSIRDKQSGSHSTTVTEELFSKVDIAKGWFVHVQLSLMHNSMLARYTLPPTYTHGTHHPGGALTAMLSPLARLDIITLHRNSHRFPCDSTAELPPSEPLLSKPMDASGSARLLKRDEHLKPIFRKRRFQDHHGRVGISFLCCLLKDP